MSQNTINRVALVGGTHGNELTGVELVKYWDRNPDLIQRSTFKTTTLLANTKAIAAGRRYVEKDLNRCFTQEQLESDPPESYENRRAQEIQKILGQPHSSTEQDLIIDIHNSTAKMNLSLIFGQLDDFTKKLLTHLYIAEPRVRLYYMPDENRDISPYLPSLAPRDICLEVGPQAHGTLLGDLFEHTQKLVYSALDFIEKWNLGTEYYPETELIIFEHWKNIDFPRHENGEIAGYIHPDRQGKDFFPVHKGDPLFRTFEGVDILWEEEDVVNPVFINEQAYYEKGVAMSLTRKRSVFF